jgi:hypothetical protein
MVMRDRAGHTAPSWWKEQKFSQMRHPVHFSAWISKYTFTSAIESKAG